MSKQDKTYQIQLNSLENGKHSLDFQAGKALFDRFDNDELYNPDLYVTLILDKQTDQLLLDLNVKGQSEIQCDRCLDYYVHYFDLHQEIVVRMADETNFNLNADYVNLHSESDYIDIAYFIFEMVILSLPIKRVHPLDADGNSTCNPEVTKYIDGESEPVNNPNAPEGSESTTNEKWKEELIELLNKNKGKNGTS